MTGRDLGLVLTGLALVVSPWAPVKLILLTALAAHLAARADRGIKATTSEVRGTLLVLGLTALVVSPYWAVLPSVGWRVLGCVGTALLVRIWASRAARSLQIGGVAASWTPWLVASGMLVYCGPSLFGPLEFRGDEDLHITRPLKALEAFRDLSASPVVLIGAALIAVLLFATRSWRGRPIVGRFAVWVLPLCAALLFVARAPAPETQLRLARYPILFAWLQTAVSFSPMDGWSSWPPPIYDEALYRLASFGSGLLLALFAARQLKGSTAFRSAAALLVGTSPIVACFSSAGYPDLPGVVIATIGLTAVWVGRGIGSDGKGALAGPALALSLMVKESVAPLIGLVAAGSSLVMWLRERPRRWLALASTSIRIHFVLLAPLMVYVGWRVLAERRLNQGRPLRGEGFGIDSASLINPALARVALQSMIDQYGFLLLLAVIPFILGRRRIVLGLTTLAPVVGQWLLLNMNVVDETLWGPLPRFGGLSRLQLTLLPSLVVLSLLGLRDLKRRSGKAAWAVVALGLAGNVALRPIGADGSTVAFWGDYVAETSGERYPYDAAYAWLAHEGETRDLLVLGRDYSFKDAFYLERNRLKIAVSAPPAPVPRSPLVLAGGPDLRVLRDAHMRLLESAGAASGPVVIHLSAWLTPADLPRELGSLRRVREFCLGRRCLLLYDRSS